VFIPPGNVPMRGLNVLRTWQDVLDVLTFYPDRGGIPSPEEGQYGPSFMSLHQPLA
jgi:hypothetical protein